MGRVHDSSIVCRLCGSTSNELIYGGRIRSGGVGSDTISGYAIYRCHDCSFVFLYPVPEGLNKFYETEEYRLKFDFQMGVEGMQDKYDHEQNARVSRIGLQNLRNKVVADFGTGAGMFLDAICGVAQKTIAVEPARIYHDYLTARGHTCYSYPEEMLRSGEKADIVVSFDTIEHVLDPSTFVSNAFDVLEEGGIFYLSMPNHEDILRLLFPEVFEPFFYQIAHLNYFDKQSVQKLFGKTGFSQISVEYLHKYGIYNLLQWSKTGRPENLEGKLIFDLYFNNVYRAEIERLCIASHLFIVAHKPS